MATDEHTLRIRVLRDQRAALDKERWAAQRLHDEQYKRIEAEIEAEKIAADPTGLRAKAVALLENRMQGESIESAFNGAHYTVRVPMVSHGFPPITISAEGRSLEEARELLIGMVIARWQEQERMRTEGE